MKQRRLTVYIPTWNRPVACLDQVRRLSGQRDGLGPSCDVKIVVAVNGDPQYQSRELHQAGADLVIQRPINLGGNANICLAYEHLAASEYLWLLSDDDPVVDTALGDIFGVLSRAPRVDVIFLADRLSAGPIGVPRSVEELEGTPVASISCTIYRGSAFISSVDQAFRSIVTYFPHVALIDSALKAGTVKSAWFLPLDQIVDLAPMRSEADALSRISMGQRSGAIFFAGGLLAYLDGDPKRRSRRTRLWWRTHWHRLSMYRLANAPEGALVDAAGRSTLATLGWWLLSLPPWWRFKDWGSSRS